MKLSLALVVLSLVSVSYARPNKSKEPRQPISTVETSAVSEGDAAIVKAINNRKTMQFVEGENMTVVKLLPDDRSGLKHQKFVVETSAGQKMTLIYNLDMCERVPAEVGDKVGAGGMFLWTQSGPILHWLHHDPRGNRQDGYIELDGKFYCKD